MANPQSWVRDAAAGAAAETPGADGPGVAPDAPWAHGPRRRQFVLLVLSACGAWSAQAAQPLVNAGAVLLQPEEVLRARIASPGAFADYMQGVEAAASQALQAAFQRTPAGGFVVLALRPGNRSKAWLDVEAGMPAATQQAVVQAIEALRAPDIKAGVVIVAIKASFWGGRPPSRPAPAPAAWKEQAARMGRKANIEELIDALWAP